MFLPVVLVLGLLVLKIGQQVSVLVEEEHSRDVSSIWPEPNGIHYVLKGENSNNDTCIPLRMARRHLRR